MNPAGQNNLATGGDNCGPWTNLNFGIPFGTTRVNPEVQHGWGVRNYDWQFGVAVQHEILPRVAIDVSYNRRWWGNFFFTDNLALGPQDFNEVTIAAPQNEKLPDGGGYPVTFLTRNARTALGATDNYFTTGDDYGDPTVYWHGVDAQISARLAGQLFVQLGSSGGRGVRDYCDVAEKLPELYVTAGSILANQQIGSCYIAEDWLTSIRGLASWTVPKFDVLISGTFRSTPGVAPAGGTVGSNGNSLSANYNGQHSDSGGTGPAAVDAGSRAADRQPLGAGAHVPGHAQLARPAVRQDPAVRPDADERRDRPVQRVQQQHGDGVQPDLRSGDQRRDVVEPDDGAESAVRAVQRDVRLLVSPGAAKESHLRGPALHTLTAKPSTGTRLARTLPFWVPVWAQGQLSGGIPADRRHVARPSHDMP